MAATRKDHVHEISHKESGSLPVDHPCQACPIAPSSEPKCCTIWLGARLSGGAASVCAPECLLRL